MIKINYILFTAAIIISLTSCSEDNDVINDDTSDPKGIDEQLTGRWMPVKTVLNDMVVYDRNTMDGMENDTHFEREFYKDDKTVRKSSADGSINLFTWELNSSKDSIILAKGFSNERRYLIELVTEDSLSYSIEPFTDHKVIYSFVREHDETIERSDLIVKEWKYDFVWARLYSMDGFKYNRNGSVPNTFYENAKVSFNNDGTFRITTGNVINEEGSWHLDLDDMLLVIDGDFKREATLLELSQDKMIFVFKNSQDNNISYQMNFSSY